MFCRWPEYPGRMQHVYIKIKKNKGKEGRTDRHARLQGFPYEDYRVVGNRALHLPNISISASNGNQDD